MRLLIQGVVFFFVVSMLYLHAALAVDFDIGVIVETSQDKQYIQVKDRIYKVERVELLEVAGEPKPGMVKDLAEGAIVKVVMGDGIDEFRHASLVTVYRGSMEKSLMEEMELSPEDLPGRKPSLEQVSAPIRKSVIRFENGVWKN